MLGIVELSRFFSNHPLTRDAQAGAWARFASWQVRSRLQDEIIVPWIGGQRLAVRRGMTGATGNIYVGLHEFEDMMFPLHFLRDGDLFLDIGANVGAYSVLASGVCRAKTWSFEPDPETVKKLKRNVEINHLEPLVQVHDYALGDSDTNVQYTVGLDSVNRVADPGTANVRIVQQKQVDSVIGSAQPILIKMDVEGYEENVLKGAQRVLASSNLRAIELETTSPAILAQLTSLGFERAYYDPFTRRLGRTPAAASQINSLFVRDWPFVEDRLRSAKAIQVLGKSI